MRTITKVVLPLFLISATLFAQNANTSPSQQQAKAPQATTSTQGQQGITALPGSRQKLGGNPADLRVAREVLHQLIMNPYYSVFDDLNFTVSDNGKTVILNGQVVEPPTKSDAAASVKQIEGVENVKDNIEILPPSTIDDGIRRREYFAIYGFDGLSRYSWGAVPEIHIIVKNGHVRLVGIVDNETDKNMAGLRANTVPGVFSVTNDLVVAPSQASNKTKDKSKKKQ